MTIANALREFFFKLNGVKPNGLNIAEVIRSGASNIQTNGVVYEAADSKSFVLNSSTADSVKQFRITVDDAGALTATEIVAE